MSSVGWQNFFVLKAKSDAFLANLQGPVDLEDWPKKKHGWPFFSRLQVSSNHRPGTNIGAPATATAAVVNGQRRCDCHSQNMAVPHYLTVPESSSQEGSMHAKT